MEDPTENIRRKRTAEISADADIRSALEARHGQVWSTDDLRRDFTVVGFLAPVVVVRNKATDELGTLEFQHSPRLYFNWVKD
jgi:hypothetical protein